MTDPNGALRFVLFLCPNVLLTDSPITLPSSYRAAQSRSRNHFLHLFLCHMYTNHQRDLSVLAPKYVLYLFMASCVHCHHPASEHCHPLSRHCRLTGRPASSYLSPAPRFSPQQHESSHSGCCQIFWKVFTGSPSHSGHCERNRNEHYLGLWFRKRCIPEQSHYMPFNPIPATLQPFWRLFSVFLLSSLYIGILSF